MATSSIRNYDNVALRSSVFENIWMESIAASTSQGYTNESVGTAPPLRYIDDSMLMDYVKYFHSKEKKSCVKKKKKVTARELNLEALRQKNDTKRERERDSKKR